MTFRPLRAPRHGSLLLCALAAASVPWCSCSSTSDAPGNPSSRSPSYGTSSPAAVAAPLQVGFAGSRQYPPNAPGLYASSYILIDALTGKTLAYRNPDQIRPVASTQKLLTALVILEDGDLDQLVTIAPEDTRAPPSKMYFKAGERYTRRQLLTAFLIKSHNDVAEALARDNAGSVPAFCAKMNRKARQLGATQSHFVNPHGLTAPGQYSTARDMARIAYHAYRNPFIRSVVCRTGCSIITPNGAKSYETTNKLLKRMPECTGMKTGYTDASGRCLVASAGYGPRQVILVQLGSNSSRIWNDAETMLRWALRGGAENSSSSYLAGNSSSALHR
ncbi:MAG TPA: D-alanyl-D-alanine carboxypeptidase family protein [Verrucomicrobiales bacterium]|nr:D-alanyl-D-alanine carboxypeptidase family protein [Verrucomicrobiales bacterium]